MTDRDIVRILSKSVALSSGCWVFLGATNPKGYGQFKLLGRREQVHRSVYRFAFGDFDGELTVEHTCRVTRCWNPAHLTLLDRATNTALGNKYRAKINKGKS